MQQLLAFAARLAASENAPTQCNSDDHSLLRDRKDDIMPLAQHFVAIYNRKCRAGPRTSGTMSGQRCRPTLGRRTSGNCAMRSSGQCSCKRELDFEQWISALQTTPCLIDRNRRRIRRQSLARRGREGHVRQGADIELRGTKPEVRIYRSKRCAQRNHAISQQAGWSWQSSSATRQTAHP